MTTLGLILVGLAIAVGIAGILLPVLPGLLLVWGAVLTWSLFERTPLAWIVLAVASVLVVVSQIVKYLVPGRRMRAAGVPWSTLAIGGVLAIVGFFLIPVVGLVLGFLLGVYGAERRRLGGHSAAWSSTVEALRAVGLAILIELAAALIIAVTWLGAVLFG